VICLENTTDKKSAKNRIRNHDITFRVTEQERDMIDRRMAQTGIQNRRAYLLKMAIDGRVIHVELESVKEMVRLLSNATTNINQIAKRVNETGSIYAADLDDLRERYDGLWGQAKEILRKLAAL
jgi:uncharacterized protein (DUF1778 family)